MGASKLGPLDERVKTDLRMPERVIRDVDDICHRLGLSKNSFFTLATLMLMTELAPFTNGNKKRATMLKNIDTLFQKIIKAARKAA